MSHRFWFFLHVFVVLFDILTFSASKMPGLTTFFIFLNGACAIWRYDMWQSEKRESK
jgi:hypothetical protein